MSTLTQFYSGSSATYDAGVGTSPGLWYSDPVSPEAPPARQAIYWNPNTTQWAGINQSNAVSYKRVTFVSYAPTSSTIGSVPTFANTTLESIYYYAGSVSRINASGTTQIFASNNSQLKNFYGGLIFSMQTSSATTTSSGINCNNNPQLTNISGGISIATIMSNSSLSINFSGNAFDQATVDAILVAINAGKNWTSGTGVLGSPAIDISGGTNSAPGAAGLAAVSSLIAAGATVTTN